jgi:ABC-type glycerol-3-phosphate transport system substrate-binding protein
MPPEEDGGMSQQDNDPFISELTRQELVKYGLVGGAAAAAAYLGPLSRLASAAPTALDATGTVVTWSPDTRPDALKSEKWWDQAFMKANPGVKVKQLTVPYGQDTVKLRAGHKTGIVPDIIWAYSDFLYSYGQSGLVRSVNDQISAVRRKRFLPAAIDNITTQDKVYSVPFVGFPFFIYYRKDVYKKLGLKPPRTHAELLANIKATHDPPNIYGYMLTNQAISDTWNLKTAMWTHGAYYFDKRDRLALDRPQTIAAWNYYKQLGTYSPPGSMAQSDLDARQLLVDGKVAHMFTTTSFSANIEPSELGNFGAFLFPRKPGAKGASLDFYGLCIPTKAKNPAGAKAMIQFLLQPKNFQNYLARTVIGWVPMLGDAYTPQYLNNPRIKPVREFIALGAVSAKTGIVGTGYFGPSDNAPALVSTNVEKQIGDRLVVQDQDAADVLEWAVETIKKAL